MRTRTAILAVGLAAVVTVSATVAHAATRNRQAASDRQAVCAGPGTDRRPPARPRARGCPSATPGLPAASAGTGSDAASASADPGPSDGTGTASVSPAPSGSASAGPSEPTGFPTPATTGVRAGVTLVDDGRCRITESNVLITGRRFSCRLSIDGDNVTIRDSELLGGLNNWTPGGGHRFTIEHSTLGPASGCSRDTFAVGATDYTARHLLIRNFPDGFRVSQRGITTGQPILIEDNFVKLCSAPGDHSDGVQANESTAGAIIRHNTIDQRLRNDTTANIFWADNSTGGVTVENNLLMGGGYTIWLGYFGVRHSVTDNRVVDRSWDYGPSRSDCEHITWTGNTAVTIDENYQVTGEVGALACG